MKIVMKRQYLKPESKILSLRLYAFITAGSNDTESGITGPGGDEEDPITPINPGGPGDDPNASRYLKNSMWED